MLTCRSFLWITWLQQINSFVSESSTRVQSLVRKAGTLEVCFIFAGIKIKRCKESDIIFFLGFRQDTRTSKNSDASTQLPVGLESSDWPVAALRKLAHGGSQWKLFHPQQHWKRHQRSKINCLFSTVISNGYIHFVYGCLLHKSHNTKYNYI